jgi:hypothetical protein
MAGRKVVNESEARRCLAAARAARADLGQWASARGIDGRSLNAWRVNLERRRTPRRSQRPAKLVELVPTASAVSSARYVLHVGGVELEVGDSFDGQSLRRLVSLLKSC